MLTANWSDVLRSDLDKLSQLSSSPARATVPKLKEGERRNVTILFLDIQGFTAMSEKLDPEDVQLIIDNSFKILTNEIEKSHGYIDKYEGDRMMALFGSRQASEQDCERALRAALGMKRKFQEINQILAQRDIKIGIRVGVNTGLVVTGRIGKGRDQDFTVMGDAVNLASRLETNAPPNEILVSEDVVKAIGDLFLFESLGKIEVKGKAEPLSVFVVKGLNPHRTERWDRSLFTQRSQYVPRRETELLKAAADRLFEAKSGMEAIAVTAPAGIGKSRLMHEFIKSYRTPTQTEPMVIRVSASGDYSTLLGFVSELTRRILGDEKWGPRIVQDLAGDQKTIAARLVPVLRYLSGEADSDPRMRALDPQALQLEIHLALRFALERLSRLASDEKSLFVVYFEDVQWADAASLEALSFVGSTLARTHPILVLFSYRPEFKPTEEFRAAFQLMEVELGPLAAEDCRAIIHNVLGRGNISPGDEDLLVRRSGGNPFFVEELIQSLVDSGTLVNSEKGWTLTRSIDEAALPETVNRILLARIDRLELAQKETLMAAAVLGEIISYRLLLLMGADMGVSEEEIQARVEALESFGFLFRPKDSGTQGPTIAFRHALTRDVVYSMLLNHNKKILHELAGRSLERVHGDRKEEEASLLFHHFSAAGISHEGIQYGLMALDQMLRHGTLNDALKLLSRVRPLVEGAEEIERLDSETKLLDLEIRLHDFLGKRPEQLQDIQKLRSMAEARPTPQLEARVALHEANYCQATGDFRQMIDRASVGLEKLIDETRASKLRMDLLRSRGMASYNIGKFDEALGFYVRGLELAVALQDRNAEGAFYNSIGLVHFNSSHPDEALAYYSKAQEIMTTIGDRRGDGTTLVSKGLVHWTMGEYSVSLDEMRRSHQIFQEIGFKKGQAVTLGNMGLIFHKVGKYEEALSCYQKALILRREIRDRAGEGYDLVNIGVVYRHQGNYAKALEYFEAGQWLAREVGSQYLLAANLNCLSIVYRKLAENDPSVLERAKNYAQEALAIATEHKLVPARIKALSSLGRILFFDNRPDEALRSSQEALDLLHSHRAGAEGVEEDTFTNHYFILNELKRQDEAKAVLKELVDHVNDRANKIKEEEYRKSFLENVRQNRFALDEWRRLNP